MKSREIILSMFNELPENTPVFAGKVYQDNFSSIMNEEAFYQMLGRMCKNGELIRLSKGIYCRPKVSKYGIVPPSDKQLVSAFTDNEQGVVVGYAMYNSYKLTTQLPKRIIIYSAVPEERQKTVGNILLKRYPLKYNEPVRFTVQMMDVLHHYHEIQDIKSSELLNMCSKFAMQYDDYAAEHVLQTIGYPKWTVAFLKSVLDYENVPNRLDRHLSCLSTYQIPSMEELYEFARA